MPEHPDIYTVDPETPEVHIVAAAADRMKRGGLVVYPTSSYYGLGAPAFQPDALRRVFETKGRPVEKPLLLMIATLTQLHLLVRRVPESAKRMMDAFWPGGLTILFDAAPGLSPLLTANMGKVGIRLAGHPVAAALVDRCGAPISGTSANLSGHPGCTAVVDLEDSFKRGVSMILDAGPLPGGLPSTVVDATADPVRILREGAISSHRIFDALHD